ncbi:hypothetical protein Bca52824_081230 [Brassica carinata]|uniref:Uncharacterized protein n=1 Tax=Brassica carinata TaxID=52824 RepID=A0A8X7PK10_BRACI|nr:hypothetical protein Bca52824_081230 [Brassica carinata]
MYKKNKEAKLTALEAENSQTSDRQHYGIGSLQQTLVNGKQTFSEFSSSAFLDMKKLLEDAHRKIEEQAASNAAHAAIIEEQGALGKFLAATNPLYNEFVAANSST